MPSIESSDRWQTAVLWESSGYDAYGQPATSSTPDELLVRWNDKQRRMLDPKGNTIVVDASVVVNQAIPLGSLMVLGSLSEWLGTGTGSATNEDGLMVAVAYDATPDIKARESFKVVGLKRFKDTRATGG